MIRLPRLVTDDPTYAEVVSLVDSYAEAIEGIYALSVSAPLRLSGGAGGKGFQISLGPIRRFSMAKAPGTGVPARSGTTPGKRLAVPLYRIVGGVLAASGETVTAYNPSSAAVANNAWIGLDYDGEDWFVTYEECP